MRRYILAIDQGTTGTTAILVENESLKITGKVTTEFNQIYPNPGEVEHRLEDIWESVKKSVENLLLQNKVKGSEILCIGLTNQRETICPFEKSGRPLMNALVWQDRRTTHYCEQIKKAGKESWIKQKTGLPVDPYFSASKIHWAQRHNPKVQQSFERGELRWGTIDTCLLYRLSNGKSFVTDATNASRTLLMNLSTAQWDNEILTFFNIDKESLPEIKESFGYFGETENVGFLPDGIPIAAVLGDQQAALLGQAGVNPGDIKCTYGTGAFMVLNTGEKLIHSELGLLSTCGYRFNGKNSYALEGSSYIAGAAVQWFRDQLGFIKSSGEIEPLARSVKRIEEMENLLFLPYFSGIGSPHWKPSAKGALLGLTRDTGKPHMARACLEGMALSIHDLLRAFQQSSLYPISRMKVDGGAAQNDFLLEMQASISAIPIVRPQIIETTAYGVALGAMVGLGRLKLEDIPSLWQTDKVFGPNSNDVLYYQRKLGMWDEVVRRLFYGEIH